MKKLVLLDVDILQKARLSKGLLLKEVCQLAGISKSSGSRAFSRGLAGVKVARSIIKALDLRLDDVWIDKGIVRHERS